MQLSLSEICDVLSTAPVNLRKEVGGKIVFAGVSTDSRTLQKGELFVALANATSDGHNFVGNALTAGATGLVVSRRMDAPDHVPQWVVPDTEIAYGQIARAARAKFDMPVVGVTGSVGKTTVKEMIAVALSPLGPILKTPASQNNETGVPKTLLQLRPDHRAVVVEMGMRGAGQIEYLCEMAKPTIGVITIIGENHLEMLGSKDAIANAKGELLESLPETGVAILNADDPYFERMKRKAKCAVKSYGVDRQADYRAEGVDRAESGWQFTVQGLPVEIPSPARHDIGNAMAALAVALELGVSLTDAAAQLRSYAAAPMRMEIMQTNWGGTVLNDSYNAAPASMQSALETMARQAMGRKIAFLGDMKELGELSARAHVELGKVIEELGGLDALYTVGALAAEIPGADAYFPSSAEAADFAASEMIVQSGDFVLVKGSRAMAMERIAGALVARGANEP